MPISSVYETQEMPPWLRTHYQSLLDRSQGISQLDYEPYEGQRLEKLIQNYDYPPGHPLAHLNEELTPGSIDYKQAFEMGKRTGDWKPYLDMGANYLNKGTQNFPEQGNVARYMNPYQQHVIDNLIHQSGRAYNEQFLPGLERAFVGAGAHGGMRHQELAARGARDQQEALNRQIGESLHQGYGQAGQMFTADQLRKLQAAEHAPAYAAATQGARLADIAGLQSQAEMQRGERQAEKDIRYQDYLKAQGFPYEQVHQHANVVQGTPATMNSYQATQTPGAAQLNTTGQLGALSGNLLGAALAYGRRKKGGHIKKYSGGGQVLDDQNNVYYPGMPMAKGGAFKGAKTPQGPKQNVSGVKNHPFTQTSFYKKPKVGGKNKVQGMYK